MILFKKENPGKYIGVINLDTKYKAQLKNPQDE